MSTPTLYLDCLILASALYPAGFSGSLAALAGRPPRAVSTGFLALLALPCLAVPLAAWTLRPELMVLRHTHVHSPEEPEGWRPAAEAISRFYRTFDAWFGNKTTPVNGFLEPSPEEKFAERPEFELESLHRTAMIGTPGEVVERLRSYEELGVDEFSF